MASWNTIRKNIPIVYQNIDADISLKFFLFWWRSRVKASGEAARGLVKSRVEFLPAQIREVF